MTAVTLAGNSSIIDMTGTGTLGLDTTTNRAISTGTGLFTANGGLTVASGNLTLSGITGNNQVLYATNTSGIVAGVATTTTANQCLISGASIPTWGGCGTGLTQNFWQMPNSGAIDV